MRNRSIHLEARPVEDVERETIAARALELWRSCGEPVVPDDAIWREAERELIAERDHSPLPARRWRGLV